VETVHTFAVNNRIPVLMGVILNVRT